MRVNDIMAVRETAGHLIDGFGPRTRAFVQVQNGCDHRCTFCIIPYGRGPSRSVPMGAVVEQIRRLVDSGYARGRADRRRHHRLRRRSARPPRLGKLVGAILRHVPELKRLRLSSIDQVEADDALLAASPRSRG